MPTDNQPQPFRPLNGPTERHPAMNTATIQAEAEADAEARLERIRQRRVDQAILSDPLLHQICDHAGASARMQADMDRRSLILATLADECRS